MIAPHEYRHLGIFVRLRVGAGVAFVAIAALILIFGGAGSKTYWWAWVFGVMGVTSLAWAYWDLTILRSVGSRRPPA